MIPVRIDPIPGLTLFGLLALLSFGGLALSVAASRIHRLLGYAVALGYAAAWAHHFRESAHLPLSGWTFRGAVLGCSLAVIWLAIRLGARLHTVPWVRWGLAAAALAVFSILAAHQRSQYFRWLFLQHVNSIGAPLHLLLDRPVSITAGTARRAQSGPTTTTVLPDLERREDAPHVVFLLVDTLRADAVPLHENENPTLAGFERLRRDSATFTNVLANASWTKPSVASYFTGLQPETHGARDRDDALNSRHFTLAERFRELDHRTIAVVSNYAVVGRDTGFDQGFEQFEQPRARPYARAGRVIDRAMELLKSEEQDRPTFIYIHLLDPHTPYLSGSTPVSGNPTSQLPPAYLAEVRYVDEQIERFRAALEAWSTRKLVLFVTSDHGEEFGEHGGGGHGHALYSEQLRVPAYLSGPGITPAGVDSPMEARDFFELLLRLGTGESLEAALRSEGPKRRFRYASLDVRMDHSVLTRYREIAMRRIDTTEGTLIWSAYGNTFELYDRSTDPYETRNLVASRRNSLLRLRRDLDAAVPEWEPSTKAELSDESIDLLRSLDYLN